MMDLDKAIQHCKEKERLIKKDIVSIENRVRHAFNQGYEMGLKESRSEIPNTCGDAISRQAVLDLIEHYNSDGLGSVFYGYEEGVKFAGAINKLPSVSPQQRTGRWITSHIPESMLCECSECGFTCGAYSFNYCPNCGAKMEVKE